GGAGVGCGYVGVLTVDLHLPAGGSLKGKRKELLRVKAGLVKRFSCTVAEVDHHELWQRSRLSMAVVCREASEAGRQIEAASSRPVETRAARRSSPRPACCRAGSAGTCAPSTRPGCASPTTSTRSGRGRSPS